MRRLAGILAVCLCLALLAPALAAAAAPPGHPAHRPELLSPITPVYPEEAKAAGRQGTVVVSALIGRDGAIKRARVTKPLPLLGQAALDAVRASHWKPATNENGKPVPAWVKIPVKFKLS